MCQWEGPHECASGRDPMSMPGREGLHDRARKRDPMIVPGWEGLHDGARMKIKFSIIIFLISYINYHFIGGIPL